MKEKILMLHTRMCTSAQIRTSSRQEGQRQPHLDWRRTRNLRSTWRPLLLSLVEHHRCNLHRLSTEEIWETTALGRVYRDAPLVQAPGRTLSPRPPGWRWKPWQPGWPLDLELNRIQPSPSAQQRQRDRNKMVTLRCPDIYL